MKYGKQVGFAAKAAALVAVVAGVATAGFEIKETKATATAPSGICALSMARNFSGFNAYMLGTDGVGSNVIGTINFDNLTFKGKITLINNYGANNAVNTESPLAGSLTSVATGDAGTYTVTLTPTAPTGATPMVTTFVVANSGNTMLIKSSVDANDKTGAWTGLCQAL